MNLMRTHFEDSWFDPRGLSRNDLGAGPGNSAYRWRPLEWESGGKHYVNERTVGVQQTAWTFVAYCRRRLAPPLRALFWFAPDDSATAVRIPLFGGVTRIPPSYGSRVGQEPAAAVSYAVDADAYTMSMDSAFWVFNLVANVAYGERYREVMPLVRARVAEYQGRLFAAAAKTEARAAALLDAGNQSAALELITEFGVASGEQMTKDWRAFWMFLFSRTRDGFTVTAPRLPKCKPGQRTGCTSRPIPEATASGYSREWYANMIADKENAAHYAVPEMDEATMAANQRKVRIMDKGDW